MQIILHEPGQKNNPYKTTACRIYKKQTNEKAPQWCNIMVRHGASGNVDSSN
ncbi:MAG: hypothetical protein ACJATV_000673 [Granulosicoccus sp.]|jgi:hypothetical protein